MASATLFRDSEADLRNKHIISICYKKKKAMF